MNPYALLLTKSLHTGTESRPHQLEKAIAAYWTSTRSLAISRRDISNFLKYVPEYDGWFDAYRDRGNTLSIFRERGWLKDGKGRSNYIITKNFPALS